MISTVAITGMWFTRKQQPTVIGYWYAANGVGIAIGGLLSLTQFVDAFLNPADSSFRSLRLRYRPYQGVSTRLEIRVPHHRVSQRSALALTPKLINIAPSAPAGLSSWAS